MPALPPVPVALPEVGKSHFGPPVLQPFVLQVAWREVFPSPAAVVFALASVVLPSLVVLALPAASVVLPSLVVLALPAVVASPVLPAAV